MSEVNEMKVKHLYLVAGTHVQPQNQHLKSLSSFFDEKPHTRKLLKFLCWFHFVWHRYFHVNRNSQHVNNIEISSDGMRCNVIFNVFAMKITSDILYNKHNTHLHIVSYKGNSQFVTITLHHACVAPLL